MWRLIWSAVCVLFAVDEGLPASPPDKPCGFVAVEESSSRLAHKLSAAHCLLTGGAVQLKLTCWCQRTNKPAVCSEVTFVVTVNMFSSSESHQVFYLKTSRQTAPEVTKGHHRAVCAGGGPRAKQITGSCRFSSASHSFPPGHEVLASKWSMLGKLQDRENGGGPGFLITVGF